ncbi:MAG: hypothetical protein IID36_07250 [Planctomycetes bacterium]|nr:hypothetical protein [Planctomycetota bacterium]
MRQNVLKSEQSQLDRPTTSTLDWERIGAVVRSGTLTAVAQHFAAVADADPTSPSATLARFVACQEGGTDE